MWEVREYPINQGHQPVSTKEGSEILGVVDRGGQAYLVLHEDCYSSFSYKYVEGVAAGDYNAPVGGSCCYVGSHDYLHFFEVYN